MNRRHFLQTSAALAAVGLSATKLASIASAAEGKKIPVGVQVYSVRDLASKDLATILKGIAEMGYKGVEFAGYYGYSAKDIRKMMDDNGLVCCGTHTGVGTLLGEEYPKTAECNQILGNKYLIVPAGLEHALETRDGAAMTANLFNELADKAAKDGMLVGYHAHAGDLKVVDDTTPWDRFFSATKPEVVMQLDTGNCLAGGQNPVDVLKRYPGRSTTVHLKSHGEGRGCAVGDENDQIDWKGVFEICESTGGAEWYIVEQESYKEGESSMDAIKTCIENLKKMGKV